MIVAMVSARYPHECQAKDTTRSNTHYSANTIAACLLRKLHVPSTHHRAVVSRFFHQGKHLELGGLLERCNRNQPKSLVTMHREGRDAAARVHGSVRYKA